MKVYSILIIFSFIQTLICDKPGVTQQSLQDAFTISLPFIKSFHPAPFSLSGSSLRTVKLSYTELNSNNIQFRFDEFGLLHLKFLNIKGQVTGTTSTKQTTSIHNIEIRRPFTFYTSFTAELNNINWEETYVVESTKKDDGKYDVKFKSMNESPIAYNIFRVSIKNGFKEEENSTKIQIYKLNFTPFKAHLKKISGLILETLQNRLKEN